MAKVYKVKEDSKEPVIAEGRQQSGATKHIVIAEFRDINDFSKVYAVGSDVSHFNAKRIEKLIESGLVKRDDK